MDSVSSHSGVSREAATADSKPDVGDHREGEMLRHAEIVQRLTALETKAVNAEKSDKRRRENKAIAISAIIAGVGVLVAVASLTVAVFALLNADPVLPQSPEQLPIPSSPSVLSS